MNATTEPKIATEQGHWYTRTGEPCYTVTAKNGEPRATTLRDARKLDLVPSVTTITKIKAAPGLNVWKEKQILLAALTLPRIAGETDEAFAERVIEDSRAQAKAAAERGTALHGAIEKAIAGECPPEYLAHVIAIDRALIAVGVNILEGNAEHSFASSLGYGGKVDAHTAGWVVDFKTKDKIEDGKKLAYDQNIQLAAYAHGLGLQSPRCLNVFVGVEDAKVVVHEWAAEEIEIGWQMFKCCLNLWKLENNYDGGFRDE